MPTHPDMVTPLRIPGSLATFTEAQTHDLSRAVDWNPAEHPAMPTPVVSGRNGANACGFCHLPGGEGRPENASLAGLPAAYIERQIAAFADGSRHAAKAGPTPAVMMVSTARAVSSSDAEAAAVYFSRLPFTSHVKVVETRDIPHIVPFRFAYAVKPGPRGPLGQRIVEVPDDAERFERRDPHLGYTAYVPVGAIGAGSALARSGGPAGMACTGCHGANLGGAMAPPLAGRSPSGMFRQLLAFKTGARNDPGGAPMPQIAGQLDIAQMIDLAAYAGSLKPPVRGK